MVVIVGTAATGGETITAIETETTEEDDEGGRGRDRETKEGGGRDYNEDDDGRREGGREVVKERRGGFGMSDEETRHDCQFQKRRSNNRNKMIDCYTTY